MATDRKGKAEVKPNGKMGVFYIVGGRPNHQVYMPERVPEIVALYEKEKAGKLGPDFPRMAGTPKALLGIDDRLLELAREAGHRGEPNGDFITEDAEIAAKAWGSLKQINPDAYVHPMSWPIPTQAEIAKMKEKPELAKAGKST